MNKKILNMVGVLVLLGFGCAFAPKAMANEIGLKGGYQYYEGIKAGLFYTIDLGDSFALQPEVYYSQRKFQYNPFKWYVGPEVCVGEMAYDTVRFIEVPVLLKYKFNLSGRFEPVLFAGGYAGFRVSRDFYGGPVNFVLRRYVRVDGGLVVGAGFSGFERGRGKIRVHIDLRWNIGLVDFQELTPYLIEILAPPEYNKNRSFSLMVGVSF